MQTLPKQTKIFHKKWRPVILLSGLIVLVAATMLVGLLASHLAKNNKNSTPAVATVRVTASGFEPATLAVKQGTKVIWTNSDTGLHQVASNPFPKDTGLPGLKSQILNYGQTYEYTADKTGSFGYHDQLKPTMNGTLLVQKQ